MSRPVLSAQPVLRRIPGADFRFGGLVGARVAANLEHWLLTAPGANPAMLQILRDRDRRPVRNLEPFAGEFAGKYLTSAVLGYRVTRDERLRTHLADFASAGTAGNPYRSWLPIQGVAGAAVPVARGPFGVDDAWLRQSGGLPSTR